MSGIVFSIEEFSVFDGPGIRTTVFLKGCPLRCSWCHNPEGQNPEIEIVKLPNGCIGCGNCIKTADIINEKTVLTEKSIKNCPRGLIRFCGESISSEDLCSRLLKNEKILKKGGGITFSGGEPLLQSDFLKECLSILKGRLNTAVQTSGFCNSNTFAEISELADYFLFDIKLADCNLHKKYTGVSNEIILKNFQFLTKCRKGFVVRIPLIPTVTDTVENITQISEILRKNGVDYAELLPYNKMAGSKYKMVMRKYEPDFDMNIEPCTHTEIFEKYGIAVKIL